MTQEEKAINMVKEMIADGQISQEVAEKYFHELKESEDERIRENIVATIHLYYGEPLEDEAKEMIAWLEKQGEQKPADKVEPKFHEGDWVVNTVGALNQVVKVWDDGYALDNGTFISNSLATEHYHLWTIEDAKDGDVLYSKKHNLIWIYKDNEHYHAGINLNYTNVVSFDNEIVIPSNVCPANRVQKSILFQKMNEAGYEWDSINLKLNRIAQRMVSAEAKEAMYDKPAWSEEDETMWAEISNLLWEGYKQSGSKFSWDDIKNWVNPKLKSIKSQNRWKPSKEQMEALEDAIRYGEKELIGILSLLYNDLKKLREDKL